MKRKKIAKIKRVFH